jgi:peptidoglycan hydrolase FlgJ
MMDMPSVQTALPPATLQQAWKSAKEFEAMALSQLLKPMFDTVDPSAGPFGGGEAESQWRPMLIDAVAKKIEAAGGLGLAEPVFRQLIHLQEAKSR